jgi:hypothetical protein
MSTPANNFSAFSVPVSVASGRNIFQNARIGQTRSSLLNVYYFKAYGTTNGTTEFDGLEVPIILNAVDEAESHHTYSTTTGRYTAPVRGLYSFELASDDSSDCVLRVHRGTTTYYVISGGHGFTTEVALEQGDEVSIATNDSEVTCTSYTAPFSKADSLTTLVNAPRFTFGGRLIFAF